MFLVWDNKDKGTGHSPTLCHRTVASGPLKICSSRKAVEILAETVETNILMNGSLGKFPAAIHWLPLRMLRLQAGIEQILPTDSCFAPPFIHSPLTDPC